MQLRYKHATHYDYRWVVFDIKFKPIKIKKEAIGLRKSVLVLFAVLVFISAINLSSAALQCVIKASCSGSETTAAKVTDITEGHFGELTDSSVTYNARLCCWGISGLKADTTEIFRLSSSGNAHAGKLYSVPPGGSIKLSSSRPGITFGCDSSTATDDCAFSLSSIYETAGSVNDGAHGDAQCDKPGYVNLYCGAKCDPDLDAECCNNDAGATPSINSVEALRTPTPWDYCDTTGNCYNLGGEISPAACCGDDTGERKLVANGALPNPNDDACCNAQNKCVYNSVCYSSAACSGPNNGYYCNSGTWELNDCDGDGFDQRCEVIQTCDPCSVFKPGDNCNNLISQGCGGCVNGTVTNSTGNKLPEAMVRAVGYPRYNATTDAKGDYFIFNATPKSYDFSAEKSPYTPVLRANMPVSATSMTTIDFVLGRGSNLCQADCSYTSDELCHPECEGYCDGVSCCSFYNSNAKNICDNRLVYFRMSYNASHEIQCCKGSPYAPVKAVATTQINATNIVRTTRTVWYEGKLVKLVIDVFG